MCLFKNELQDTGCSHDECRNFYTYNKQLALLNLSQNPQASLLLNQTSLLQAQAQSQALNTPILSQPIHPLKLTQTSLNGKRLPSPHGKSNFEDEEIMLNKKVKTELSSFFPAQFTLANGEMQLRDRNNTQVFGENVSNNILDLSRVSQQLINGNSGSNPLLGSLLGVNNVGVLSGNAIQDNNFFPFNNNLRVQNNIVGLNDIQSQSLLQAQLEASNPLSQLLLQAKKNNGPANSQSEKKMKTESSLTNEAFLQEFQSRMFGLFMTQNKMLEDLTEKNDMMQDTLALLIKEINLLKVAVRNTREIVPTIQHSDNPLVAHQHIGNSTETITVDKLLVFLYGKNADFQHQLILKHDLPLPLYRERNFRFTVVLTDKKGNLVENANRIPLTIGIYTSESPPKFIDSNTAGNKILKGFIDKDLVNGSVTFDKVQIKEVTSHFRNGWVFLVVYPKVAGNTANQILSNNGTQINTQKIKPLVLEKVVVKAKKAKEKDQGNDLDDKVKEEGNTADSPTDSQ